MALSLYNLSRNREQLMIGLLFLAALQFALLAMFTISERA
jgi:hypothetical protein